MQNGVKSKKYLRIKKKIIDYEKIRKRIFE